MGTSLVRPWSHKICSVKTHRKITNFCFAVLCWRWLCVYQTSLAFKVQFFSRPPASLSFDGPVAQGPGSSRALSPWVAGPLEGLSILCSIHLVTRFTFFPDSRVNGSLWTLLRVSTFFALKAWLPFKYERSGKQAQHACKVGAVRLCGRIQRHERVSDRWLSISEPCGSV